MFSKKKLFSWILFIIIAKFRLIIDIFIAIFSVIFFIELNCFYIESYILYIQLNLFHIHSYIQLSFIFIHSSEAPGCQPIPCCPEKSTSVYLTEGPYISEVKVGVNVDHVIRNRVVVIETIIKIPKLLNISKGNRIVECGMMYWFCYIFID